MKAPPGRMALDEAIDVARDHVKWARRHFSAQEIYHAVTGARNPAAEWDQVTGAIARAWLEFN